MNIEVDGIEFDIDIDVDQDIESRELIVEVTAIRYNNVNVADIIDPKLLEKVEDKAWDIARYGRKQ